MLPKGSFEVDAERLELNPGYQKVEALETLISQQSEEYERYFTLLFALNCARSSQGKWISVHSLLLWNVEASLIRAGLYFVTIKAAFSTSFSCLFPSIATKSTSI